MAITTFATGYFTAAGLIIAIGAQNAFVLSQALRKNYHLVIALVCALIDAVLITAGLLGMGSLIAGIPSLSAAFAWGGALFLTVYGARAFKSALAPGSLETEERSGPTSLMTAVTVTLAISLLNPHVYLDTVILIGSIGSQFDGHDKLIFGIGAISASASWFALLGIGGARLAPLFARPAAWRVLDILVGIVMWTIAGSLVWSRIG